MVQQLPLSHCLYIAVRCYNDWPCGYTELAPRAVVTSPSNWPYQQECSWPTEGRMGTHGFLGFLAMLTSELAIDLMADEQRVRPVLTSECNVENI